MEGIGEADDKVDAKKKNCTTGRISPWQQGQRKERNTIGRNCDGQVSEPSAAIGDMAVLAVYLEPINLTKEEKSEYQMSKFMVELHHPAGIGPDPGYQEQDEKGEESKDESNMVL